MTHGSLFSGIGGFDLAAEWMGWENKFHCEWNEFGQKILKHYWPNAESYGDITKTDFTIWKGRIDVLSGGFPCQPYSQAGKRKGKEDDRHLWPEMLRAIREIQPVYVVGENVRGLTNWNGGLVFDEVQSDLETEGYEVAPFLLPACAVNAPHRRDRIWFVAHCDLYGQHRRNGEYEINASEGRQYAQCDIEQGDSNGFSTNSRLFGQEITEEQATGIEQCDKRNDTYSSNERLQRSKINRGIEGSGKNGNKFTPRFLCPNWEEFPTQPPICSGDDGLSYDLDGITFPKWRNESIKGFGNAVVPKLVLQIFKAIEETDYKVF